MKRSIFFKRRVFACASLKVRNSLWFGTGVQQFILFSCRRDSQSRKQNRWRKCVRFQSQRPLAHFCTATQFGNCPACRSGVYLVFWKRPETKRLRGPGPARSGCVLGLGRDVFLGGRSRERSVPDRFCSESIEQSINFNQRSRIESRRHRQKLRIGRRPETHCFAHEYGREGWNVSPKSCWNRLPTNGRPQTCAQIQSYVCM